MEKTNVMRLLDKASISYKIHCYDSSVTDGISVAHLCNENENQVFKTLVTIGSDKNHYVFCIPVNATLDLKKGAKAVGIKSIEMIPQKELLPLTGYVHGGCSPIGMKKPLKTFINDTAVLFQSICVSGGRVGFQIEISPQDLSLYVKGSFVDVIKYFCPYI